VSLKVIKNLSAYFSTVQISYLCLPGPNKQFLPLRFKKLISICGTLSQNDKNVPQFAWPEKWRKFYLPGDNFSLGKVFTKLGWVEKGRGKRGLLGPGKKGWTWVGNRRESGSLLVAIADSSIRYLFYGGEGVSRYVLFSPRLQGKDKRKGAEREHALGELTKVRTQQTISHCWKNFRPAR
jgi:hypothetical protein